MDRSREARRSSMATTGNGFPRRRHRTIGLRDSSEEGQVELQETVRLRAVSNKRDRDRDFSNKSKRRRGSHREEGDQSTDESVGNEEEYEVEDGGISRIVFPNTSLPVSDQSHRRNILLARPARPAPPPRKNIDEVIGAMVPRKARSASVKRPHDSWVSAIVSGEDKNFPQRSNSPERHSAEAASPSSSNVSVRKKMKASGPKTRLPKTTQSPSPAQEDIEIEIAEVLYGLRTSRNQDSSRMLETNDAHDINGDSKALVPSPIMNSQASMLPRSHSPSNSFMDVEKKKVEDDSSSTVVPKNLSAEVVRVENEQQGKLETSSSESAKLSESHDDNAIGCENESSKAPKVDSEDNWNSSAGCGGTADERPKSTTEELPPCSKLDVDKHEFTDSRGISAVQETKSERVERFEIDLMAPPPMVLSPERDDFSRGDLTSQTLAPDAELKSENNIKIEDKVEKLVKNEKEHEEMKMGTCKENRELLELDMEKPNNNNGSATSNKLEKQNRNQEQASNFTNHKVEKTAQSGSVTLSTVVPGWPGSLPPLGYMPHLQTVLKADKNVGLSTASQHMNIAHSQPGPKKRCATHHYIACNISLQQQYMKMNQFWPAAVGSGSVYGTKPKNASSVASSESTVVGKQTKQNLPGVNQNASQEKLWPVTSFPGLAAHKSSEAAKLMDSTQKKQFVLQQGPKPAPAGNLVLDPASLLPMGQPQAPVTTATSQAGGAKSSGNAPLSSKSSSSASGSLGTASALPTVAAAMSFSYANLPVNDASYVAIVQNNGYPFPFSTPLGATSAIRGGSPAQATPILNGPFYTSQMFHPLQHAQQHPHSNALVRSSYPNTNTSDGSSLSHKQPRGAQVNGSNILTTTTQLQQPQKQHNSLPRSHKLEAEMGGVNAPSVASQNSYSQKNVYGQNLTVPAQPVNLSFRPSAASDSTGGNSRNFGENQQQQASKGGVELIPSQAFAISFAAFNGTSMPSNLNFSSMAQNPVIFHSLPDVAWQGYQAGVTSHTTQQKTCSTSEGKTGGNPSHHGDDKKVTSMKSSNNGPTTLVFDNSSKNLNFMFSPVNANWPSRSVASTSIATNASLSSNASSSQQAPQLPQPQKQHAMQQQQTPVGTRYNASSTNTMSSTKFVNSPPVFSQTLVQCNNSNQGPQSKSSRRTPDSQVPHTSIITTAPMLKNFPSEQGRVLQGHTQISFAGNQYSPLPPHGQRVLTSNQPLCTTAAGSPTNGGNLKPNSHGSKAGSSINTLQMQQTENSSAATGQKSSPVCGRNVPSILSSCSNHLSELKY